MFRYVYSYPNDNYHVYSFITNLVFIRKIYHAQSIFRYSFFKLYE